jgi:hypothetical protein
MTTNNSQGSKMIKNDDRLEDICKTYKELNVEEKKKLERIAVRLFNTQTIIETDKSISTEENDEYNGNQ